MTFVHGQPGRAAPYAAADLGEEELRAAAAAADMAPAARSAWESLQLARWRTRMREGRMGAGPPPAEGRRGGAEVTAEGGGRKEGRKEAR